MKPIKMASTVCHLKRNKSPLSKEFEEETEISK